MSEEPKGDDRLTKVMYDACQGILDCFVEGAPFKVTILLRCTDDPVGHVIMGNDSFEGAKQGLQDLIDGGKNVQAQIVSRGAPQPKGTIQ